MALRIDLADLTTIEGAKKYCEQLVRIMKVRGWYAPLSARNKVNLNAQSLLRSLTELEEQASSYNPRFRSEP